MPRTLRRAAAAAIAVAAAVTLAGCAGTPSSSSTAADGELQTVTAGKLTIATGEPDYEPWFVDDDPSNGKGFEGAVANAPRCVKRNVTRSCRPKRQTRFYAGARKRQR